MSDTLKPALHGREHCPGGEDPIPCLNSDIPWIRRNLTTDVTIGSGGNDIVLEYDTTVGSDDYATYFATTNANNIKILQAGVYVVTAEFQFSDIIPEGATLSLVNLDYNWPTSVGQSHLNDHTIQGTLMFNMQHRYTANTFLFMEAVQFSASDFDIIEGYFEVQRIGTYTGTNPEDGSPPQ